MTDVSELLKTLGESVHHDEQLGDFFTSFGTWRLQSMVDFPFQSDVEMLFELTEKVEAFPPSMPGNVGWIQDHLVEIWNLSAKAINDLAEVQRIEMPDEFSVDTVSVQLSDKPVANSNWRLMIDLSCGLVSFEIIFCGLTVVDCSLT